MKARVKSTGELLEVRHKNTGTEYSYVCDMQGECGTMWKGSQLELLDDDPDYWNRLEHQYAGMAMQGMSEKFFKDYRDYCAGFGDMDEDEAKATMKDFADAMADVCYYFAHALVEKYKKEERK